MPIVWEQSLCEPNTIVLDAIFYAVVIGTEIPAFPVAIHYTYVDWLPSNIEQSLNNSSREPEGHVSILVSIYLCMYTCICTRHDME